MRHSTPGVSAVSEMPGASLVGLANDCDPQLSRPPAEPAARSFPTAEACTSPRAVVRQDQQPPTSQPLRCSHGPLDHPASRRPCGVLAGVVIQPRLLPDHPRSAHRGVTRLRLAITQKTEIATRLHEILTRDEWAQLPLLVEDTSRLFRVQQEAADREAERERWMAADAERRQAQARQLALADRDGLIATLHAAFSRSFLGADDAWRADPRSGRLSELQYEALKAVFVQGWGGTRSPGGARRGASRGGRRCPRRLPGRCQSRQWKDQDTCHPGPVPPDSLVSRLVSSSCSRSTRRRPRRSRFGYRKCWATTCPCDDVPRPRPRHRAP